MSAVPADATTESSGRVTWRRLVRLQARVPLLQICALIAVFSYGAIDLGFWNWGSVKQTLVLASLAGLASVGQTLLILMGGFDLSVSGFIVASALVVSVLKEKWNVSFLVAILIGVVAAAILETPELLESWTSEGLFVLVEGLARLKALHPARTPLPGLRLRRLAPGEEDLV